MEKILQTRPGTRKIWEYGLFERETEGALTSTEKEAIGQLKSQEGKERMKGWPWRKEEKELGIICPRCEEDCSKIRERRLVSHK